MPATYTQDDFLRKARQHHGDKYDYSLAVFVTTLLKVIIICPDHGRFEQKAHLHMTGSMCRQCRILKTAAIRLATARDAFVTKAKELHNSKYTYTNTQYKHSLQKVIITCPVHGDFEQLPSNHLQGYGCSKCAVDNTRLSQREFIDLALNKHGKQYDYSETKYITANAQVTIICKKHGSFLQRAGDHLQGCGCPICPSGRSFSNQAIEWLNLLSKMYNIDIQHQLNGGEYRFAKGSSKRADGFCKETNTVYEYLGNFFHGNPKIFAPDAVNEKLHCTFGELYQKTLERNEFIKQQGYNLVIIWEDEWKALNRAVRVIQKAWRRRTPAATHWTCQTCQVIVKIKNMPAHCKSKRHLARSSEEKTHDEVDA